MKMYVDGKLQVDTDNNPGLLEPNGFYIGSTHVDSVNFNGQIDEVKIYNYALTAEQVKNDYNGGAVRFGQ